jgi:predicted dienelactone hydrolase
MRKLVFLLLFLAAPVLPAQDVAQFKLAGRDVALWKPSGPAPETGYPIIVFSHGFGGCNTQSTFLMEALAHAGYLVLAPNHKDARCRNAQQGEEQWYPGKRLRRRRSRRPQQPFRKYEKWTDATYKDRAADIRAVLDAVLRGSSFQGLAIDRSRIGIAGHSLGGYTALGLAGAWPSWKDARFKAVLALSPFSSPYISRGALGKMNVPVMYQGGTRDLGVTPTVKRASGAYDLSSPPKYLVEFDGAGHLAWTNLVKTYQPLIDAYSVAFFNHYLKGATSPDPLAPLITNPPPPGVSLLKAAAQ